MNHFGLDKVLKQWSSCLSPVSIFCILYYASLWNCTIKLS